MKKIKVLSAVLAMIMLISCFPFTALADGEKTVNASFYILNEGLPVPTGTGSQPVANYSPVGDGKITITDGYKGEYKEEGVPNIVEAPEVKLDNGQSIVWYVTKYETDKKWHVDGVITPFYTFIYDGNNASGSTTDPTHYFEKDIAKVAENAFSKEGYTFSGWNTKADGSGISYNPGDEIVIKDLGFPKGINTLTLYATWLKKPATGETTTTKPEETTKPETTKPETTENESKKKTIYVVTPKKMSVRFEDGEVYKTNDKIEVEVGKEYKFQMCSNDWNTDSYSDYGYGIAGTVVYTMKLVSEKDFVELRKEAIKNTDRYTVKGMDIIDKESKTIIINKDAENSHLETDVNDFFMAYKFHFNTDYNKQTGILHVVNTPLESLSVNLPLGSTIFADAYVANKYKKTDFVFVEKDNEHPNRSYKTYNWGF